MALQESGEMYLETILILSHKKANVHAIDIAEYMKYSKPSVSHAMGVLLSGGYISIDPSNVITLTDSGRAVAETIYERHQVLSELLVRLGVNEETAAADACKVEHVISAETFDAIKAHMKQHPAK